MNEKFLSRGKREDNGEWITGYYVKIPNQADKLRKENHIIFELDGQVNYVIPETVGRCIDLTDKNGTLIFEGDILKRIVAKQEIIYTVDWCDNCALFVLPCITREELETDFTIFNGYDFEIIGNVHDNPELIGENENERN